MNKKAVIVGLLALGALAALLYAPRAAAATAAPDDAAGDYMPPQPVYDPGAKGWIDTFENWANQLYFETENNAMPLTMPINAQTNVAALLAAIKQAEGTAREADPYRVCYGYKHRIVSFDDHPAVTREWLGETLPPAMCAAAGYGAGCVSTAAGAFQIIKPTWLAKKTQLALPDFSPASQDAAAVQLLKDCGAYQKIIAGDLPGAVAAARKTWASLPGAGYAQPEKSLAWITERFMQAGGVPA